MVLTRYSRGTAGTRSVGREYPPAATHRPRARPPARNAVGGRTRRTRGRTREYSVLPPVCRARRSVRCARLRQCASSAHARTLWPLLGSLGRPLGVASAVHGDRSRGTTVQWAARTRWAPGRRRLWHAGSQPRWQDRVLPASWCSDPVTSKRRLGPWCSTSPLAAKCHWQGPQAGLSAAGSGGAPGRFGSVRALPCRALQVAVPAEAVQRHGPPPRL